MLLSLVLNFKSRSTNRMEHKICVLIVDSVPESVTHTQEILSVNLLIERIDIVEDSDQALLKILHFNPDIVLLEFPSKGEKATELLQFIKTKFTDTTIVFISDSKDNAVQAIHNGIYHYLLKPVQKDKLNRIIGQVHLIKQNSVQLKIKQIIEKSTEEKRLRFHTSKGYILIDQDEILYCMADGIFTEMYLTRNRMEVIYMFLSKIEALVDPNDFLRSSRKYLINKRYIRKVFKNSNTILLFHDGKEYLVNGWLPVRRL